MTEIAVVVSTYQRADRLHRLVRALEDQSLDPARYEVVVVDNGSTDATAAVLARLAEAPRCALRVVRIDRNAGPAPARNLGWRSTLAPVVAFTDDDCAPDRDWLTRLLAVRDATGADVIQGRTEPDPVHADQRGPFSHTIRIDRLTHRFETCNVAYTRAVLDACGGFDETFTGVYGEDIDLGWRALATGARPAHAPDAVVFHEIEPSSWRRRLRRATAVGPMTDVVARHPGFRRHLFGRVFVDRSHGWALVATGGIAGAVVTRRAAPLVAVAPYVAHRLGAGALWQRWKAPVTIPGAFVVDLVEVATLLWASARTRTPVL